MQFDGVTVAAAVNLHNVHPLGDNARTSLPVSSMCIFSNTGELICANVSLLAVLIRVRHPRCRTGAPDRLHAREQPAMKDELTFEQLCELFNYTPKGGPLDSKEVAKFYGVNPGTPEQWRFRGEGPRYFQPPGTRKVWYSERDVLAWLASGARQSTSEQIAA